MNPTATHFEQSASASSFQNVVFPEPSTPSIAPDRSVGRHVPGRNSAEASRVPSNRTDAARNAGTMAAKRILGGTPAERIGEREHDWGKRHYANRPHMTLQFICHFSGSFHPDLPVAPIFRNRVKPSRQKYFSLSEAQISRKVPPNPRLTQRGASRTSRNVARGAMDALASIDERVQGGR
jgi:hypothetical protein